MKKHLSSIIKLIVSLGIGVLIVWWAYNNISKPQDVLIPEEAIGQSEIVYLVEDSTYVEEGDTLAIVSLDSGEEFITAHTEGVFRLAESARGQKTIGTLQVQLLYILKTEIQGANPIWLVLCMLVSFCSHLPRIFRWQMMLEPLGHKPRFSVTAIAVYITYVANLAFPRLGEITRCGVISRYEKIPFNQVVGTMITERAIDLLCLLAFGVVTLLTQFDKIFQFFEERVAKPLAEKGLSMELLILIGVGFLGLIFLFFFLQRNSNSKFINKIQELIRGVINGVKSIKDVKNIPLFVFYTVLMWFLYFIMIYICFQAFPESKGLALGAGLSCFFFGSISLILVQGGIGAYPLAIKEVLLLYGVSAAQGYAFGWVIWIAITLVILISGGAAIIAMSQIKERPNDKLGTDSV